MVDGRSGLQVTPDSQDKVAPPGNGGSRTRVLVVLAAALTPALVAVWAFPGFVTQDGPAHLYNAHILTRSFDQTSPFRDAFSVRWEPLPNWAGHAALMALVSTLPPRTADRAMTTLTLVGLAAAVVWLRMRVAGPRGGPLAAVYAVVLALNVTWLLGFTSFLIGACLFPITLGVWWSGRDTGFSVRRAWELAALTTLGYFCHLVSLGLTAFGLVVLESLTPGRARRGRTWVTALGLLPLVPLGGLYLGLMRRGGGGFAPDWGHLANPLSWKDWVVQLTWVDPITVARKDVVPLVEGYAAPWCAVFAPVLWLVTSLAVAVAATWAARQFDRDRLGWWVLAGLLLLGGVAGPDSLGANHGEYMQQRAVLLGLVTLAPVLRFDLSGWLGRLTATALAVTLALQSALVWDYARTSERTAGAILRAGPAVGTGKRVASVLIDIRTRFRANPLLHADCALGVGTGNVIWDDYETRFYYFPVRFREGLDRPDPVALELIALSDTARLADYRARLWSEQLEKHHQAIDTLVVWGSDPAVDAINAARFETTYTDGKVRVLQKRRP